MSIGPITLSSSPHPCPSPEGRGCWLHAGLVEAALRPAETQHGTRSSHRIEPL